MSISFFSRELVRTNSSICIEMENYPESLSINTTTTNDDEPQSQQLNEVEVETMAARPTSLIVVCYREKSN